MSVVDDIVTGNSYDKYRATNPLHRALMRRFLGDAADCVRAAGGHDVLEIGCGPGDLAARLFTGHTGGYVGIDISAEQVVQASRQQPGLEFCVSRAECLPFDDTSFDLVVACEVLEHLDRPQLAIDEMARVCRGHVLVSVPWEPVWRMLNVARGAYWSSLGNTPGHVGHFSREAIRRLVNRRFEIVEERRPFPWTMLLAKSRPR